MKFDCKDFCQRAQTKLVSFLPSAAKSYAKIFANERKRNLFHFCRVQLNLMQRYNF